MIKKLLVFISVLVIGAMMFVPRSTAAPPSEDAVEEVASEEGVVEEEVALFMEGQLQLAGSTTVHPLAEVLSEAFMDMNE